MVAATTPPPQNQTLQNKFSKGAVVEVTPDEDGFKGAWYVATVIDPNPAPAPRKSPKKLFIEYHTLLDDDGLKPLRESVNLSFIRPIPPDELDVPSFELNDVVDAFYQDGWWTGVIKRVVSDSRVVVFFQNPPDLIEFGVDELRVHRKWVSGKWIRPEKLIATGLMFSKGQKVEVSLENEGCCDIWFPATILEEKDNGSFLVEYQSKGINDVSESAKVIVDLLHIRPSPPCLEKRNFLLLEKVDAFIDCGWWPGIITKELADSRYIVFFKSRNNERELNHSEIRSHLEWKNGSWSSSSQDVHQPEVAVSRGNLGNLEGNSVERTAGSIKLMEKQLEHSIPCKVKKQKQLEHSIPCKVKKHTAAMTSSKKKTKLATPDTDDQPSRPCKKLKNAPLIETTLVSPCQTNTASMDIPSEDTQFGSATSVNVDIGKISLEKSMVGESPSINACNFSRGKKARSKRRRPSALENTSDSLRRKGGRPQKSPTTGLLDLGGDKKDDAVGSTEENFVEIECVTKEIPARSNLNFEAMDGKLAKEPNQLPPEECVMEQRLHLQGPAVKILKEGIQLEGDGGSISRRRGKSRKPLVKIPEASAQVNQLYKGDMVVEDCMKTEVGLPTVLGLDVMSVKKCMKKPSQAGKKNLDHSMELKGNSNSSMRNPRANMDTPENRKVVEASPKKSIKNSSNKRGRRITININTGSLVQGLQDATLGEEAENSDEDVVIKEVQMAIDQSPNNMADDQPLSMWFEGMQHPKANDASDTPQSRNTEQCIEANGRQDSVMQSLDVDGMAGIVPYQDKTLPFVMNPSIWNAIESLEAFQKMPQNPHFRPLVDSCKESSLEGLAIGCMVNFASVVEQISKLQLNSPRSVFEEKLETLLELKSQGFDISKPHDRLTGLLLMRDKAEQSENHKQKHKSSLSNVGRSNSELDKTIADIDNQMRMLNEKRALALSEKEKNGSLVSSLESTIEVINNEIESAQREFEALVVAPW